MQAGQCDLGRRQNYSNSARSPTVSRSTSLRTNLRQTAIPSLYPLMSMPSERQRDWKRTDHTQHVAHLRIQAHFAHTQSPCAENHHTYLNTEYRARGHTVWLKVSA